MYKVLPYVYKVTNKYTNQYYYGFRCANKVPAEDDLGTFYFTSSASIKQSFENFTCEILAIFFNKDDAYQFEQSLIKENFADPLILNKHWQDSKKFSMAGFHRPDVAERNKINHTKPKETRIYKCPQCGTENEKVEFVHKEVTYHFCNASCKNKYYAAFRQSTKGLPNVKNKGKPAWNKGLKNPCAADNARKGAKNLSSLSSGRKRHYTDDTTWTWKYLDDNGWYLLHNGNKIYL